MEYPTVVEVPDYVDNEELDQFVQDLGNEIYDIVNGTEFVDDPDIFDKSYHIGSLQQPDDGQPSFRYDDENGLTDLRPSLPTQKTSLLSDVVVIVSHGVEDCFFAVYKAEDVDGIDLLNAEGCMSSALDDIDAISEPSEPQQLFDQISENGWKVVRSATAIFY